MKIITSSIVMKSEPIETSPLETECLFGETVEILDKHFDWVYCKLETDNYCGWIKKKDWVNQKIQRIELSQVDPLFI